MCWFRSLLQTTKIKIKRRKKEKTSKNVFSTFFFIITIFLYKTKCGKPLPSFDTYCLPLLGLGHLRTHERKGGRNRVEESFSVNEFEHAFFFPSAYYYYHFDCVCLNFCLFVCFCNQLQQMCLSHSYRQNRYLAFMYTVSFFPRVLSLFFFLFACF